MFLRPSFQGAHNIHGTSSAKVRPRTLSSGTGEPLKVPEQGQDSSVPQGKWGGARRWPGTQPHHVPRATRSSGPHPAPAFGDTEGRSRLFVSL